MDMDCKSTKPVIKRHERLLIRFDINIGQDLHKAIDKLIELRQQNYLIMSVSGWGGNEHQVNIELQRDITEDL